MRQTIVDSPCRHQPQGMRMPRPEDTRLYCLPTALARTIGVFTFLIVASTCSAQLPGVESRLSLQERIEARLDSLPAASSLYAIHLVTGQKVGVRADVPMSTMSVIKIPIMVLAFRDAEAGRLNLEERYTLRVEDLRGGTGVLQTFAPGLRPTYRDLVGQMMITSDNSATDIMIARLGLDRVNHMLDSLGYRETRLRTTIGEWFRGIWKTVDPKYASLTDREVFDRTPLLRTVRPQIFAYNQDSTKWFGRSTAREIAKLLDQLEGEKLASPPSTKDMREILQRQLYYSRLPQRIRFRVVVGHKTGDSPPAIGNDVGILYSRSGPIVIAVFTNGNLGNYADLDATIARVAEDILDAWDR